MSSNEIEPIQPINANRATSDHDEKIAEKLVKTTRRREVISFAIGFTFYASLEFFRFRYFENAIGVWTLRGWFIPAASLVSMLALISSVSMQSSLKDRGVENAITKRKECYLQLLTNKDDKGLRLLQGIAIAGTIGAFGLGTVVALAICNTILI